MGPSRFKVSIPRQHAPVELDREVTLCARFALADGIGSIGFRYGLAMLESGVSFNLWPTNHLAGCLPDGDWQRLRRHMRRCAGRNVLAIAEQDEAFRSCRRSRRFRVAMYEATRIPEAWVDKYNRDPACTLLVPDPWVMEIFRDSGVSAPIRVVPLGVEPAEPCEARERPFTIGSSAYFEERKNHGLVIRAFKAAFGSSTDVRLRIHGRGGHCESEVRAAAAGDPRVTIETGALGRDQFDAWWASNDAYVLASSGEGYSHTPREALMRAIPTAITDFSAHRTLVRRGTVVPIPVRGLEPAYKHMFRTAVGQHARVSMDDVVEVLRWLKENRSAARAMAWRGREQVLALDTWRASTQRLLTALGSAA